MNKVAIVLTVLLAFVVGVALGPRLIGGVEATADPNESTQDVVGAMFVDNEHFAYDDAGGKVVYTGPAWRGPPTSKVYSVHEIESILCGTRNSGHRLINPGNSLGSLTCPTAAPTPTPTATPGPSSHCLERDRILAEIRNPPGGNQPPRYTITHYDAANARCRANPYATPAPAPTAAAASAPTPDLR